MHPNFTARRLLFLPGAGADPAFWQPVGELLPRGWKKRYLGWPGIGHNPPAPEVRSFDDLIDLAEAELCALSTPDASPVDLLAQSMGGAIALALALRRPKLVGKMVLAVTAGGMDVESLGAVDWRPGYRLEYPEAASWLYDARPDFGSALGKIDPPTLLLWGDDDPISPPRVGAEFERLLPHASLVVVPGGTHALVAERAGEVAPLILDHLSS